MSEPVRIMRDLVAIGCSAGGLDALARILRMLPRDLGAAVLIVQHMPETGPRYLAGLLARAATLPVDWAEHGDPIVSGRVYVAPPDVHLLVADGHLRLIRSARENYARPSIDKLFRSVAACHGSRAIGVLLTGMLNDGVGGLQAIRDAGGIVIVQDPADAKFSELPSRALRAVKPERVLPIDAIGAALRALVGCEVQPVAPPSAVAREAELDRAGSVTPAQMDELGVRTTLACPDCHGPMWQLGDEAVRRYRCYLGHVATARDMLSANSGEIESALWSAVRALDDRASMLETLAADARRIGDGQSAEQYGAKARNARTQAEVARRFMLDLSMPHDDRT